MTSVPHHTETSQLTCTANQLTGFYMMGNIGRQWVKNARRTNEYGLAYGLPIGFLMISGEIEVN